MTIRARVLLAALLASGCGGASCEEIDREALAVVAEGAACSSDDECSAVLVPDSCVPGATCWVALSSSADESAVRAELQAASEERRSAGCACGLGRCASTAPAAVCSTGHCGLRE